MLRYAHVLDGQVTNVSAWASEPTEEERARYAPEVLIAATGSGCGPGWSYADGVFRAPPAPVTYRIARVYSGAVIAIDLRTEPLAPHDHILAAPVLLVACGDEVQVGWRYADGAFAP